MVPFVVGTVILNMFWIANQELVIPRIASQLRMPHGQSQSTAQRVEPIFDQRGIWIGGRELFLGERRLHDAEFVLPTPQFAREFTRITALDAYCEKGKHGIRPGWILKGANPAYHDLHLTAEGQNFVRPHDDPGDLFVDSDITVDQLNNRNASYRYLSTWELIDRIRHPAFGKSGSRDPSLHLHARLTRPLWNVIAVLIAISLVVRRESPSLITNLATSTIFMGGLFGTVQAFQYFGQLNLIGPDFAAWGPVIVAGTLGAWASEQVRT
jgi:hypothetical protein